MVTTVPRVQMTMGVLAGKARLDGDDGAVCASNALPIHGLEVRERRVQDLTTFRGGRGSVGEVSGKCPGRVGEVGEVSGTFRGRVGEVSGTSRGVGTLRLRMQ